MYIKFFSNLIFVSWGLSNFSTNLYWNERRYFLLTLSLVSNLCRVSMQIEINFFQVRDLLLFASHDLKYFLNLFQGLYLFQSFDQNVVHALCSLNTKYAVKQIIACTESFLLNILLQFFLLFSLFCVTFCFSNIFMLQRKLVWIWDAEYTFML